jgi:hypothetical protein
VQLARLAHTASQELGVELPPALQAEHLMREASLQESQELPLHTENELSRLRWVVERQDEINARLHKKHQRLELAVQARRMSNECGLGVSDTQLLAERQALEMAATPSYMDEDYWITAGDYLLYARGHSDEDVRQLQTSFGRTLKSHHLLQRGVTPDATLRDYGSNEVPTCVYHARRDRALLNAAYQAFALTDLYRRVVSPVVQALNNV